MGYGCNHILSYKKVGSDMSYVALYRIWRPDTYHEVKVKYNIVTTLRNQRYLQRHVTVNIRLTEVRVMSVQAAVQ